MYIDIYIKYYLIFFFRFAAKLENFFNPILLVNFTISSILICMVGFQLVTGKDMFIGDYVKFIVYISSSLSQLYVLCWNGDSLIQHVIIIFFINIFKDVYAIYNIFFIVNGNSQSFVQLQLGR